MTTNNKKYFIEISLKEFSFYFASFKNEAFRIELLQKYLVDGEKELFEKYKINKLKDEEFLSYHKDWIKFLQKSIKKQKNVMRVHAVEKPFSNYINFEINFPYKYNIQNGEKIKLLVINKNILNFLIEYKYLSDFWLFDNKECIFLKYDNEGQFLGVQKLKDEYLTEIMCVKNYFLQESKFLVDI